MIVFNWMDEPFFREFDFNNIKGMFRFVCEQQLGIAMKKWLKELSDEEVKFLHRFVLSSGSLKELASLYGVTYPTIRLRLDRLIEKVKLESEKDLSPFERTLRQQFSEGKVDSLTFKLLLDAHYQELRAGESE